MNSNYRNKTPIVLYSEEPYQHSVPNTRNTTQKTYYDSKNQTEDPYSNINNSQAEMMTPESIQGANDYHESGYNSFRDASTINLSVYEKAEDTAGYTANQGYTENSYEDIGYTEEKVGIQRWIHGTPAIVLAACLGAVFGVVLNFLEINTTIRELIAFPGDLFIRGMKLLVIPMVFCSLTVGMTEIISIKKESKIGGRAALLYLFTSILASTQGVLWATVYRGGFTQLESNNIVKQPNILLKCKNPFGNQEADHYLQWITNNGTNSITCAPLLKNATSAPTSAKFTLVDINNVFQMNTRKYPTLSLSEQFMALSNQIISSNIAADFVNGRLLGVIAFAIVFGVAIVKGNKEINPFDLKFPYILHEINNAFLFIIQSIMTLTPFAIFFLIAGSLIKHNDNMGVLKNIGYLIATIISSLLSHVLIIMPGMFYLTTKQNPYSYLKRMVPCQVFALGCASSMATLPVTLSCVRKTHEVGHALSRFLITIGATINMDGGAIYFPAGVIFLAEAAGKGNELGIIKLFLLIIVSTLASVGGAPIPSAGLVMLMTVWQSVMNSDVPSSISYLIASDWLLDRFRTMVNVTGDCIVTRIIAEQVGETYEGEQKRIRENEEQQLAYSKKQQFY